MGARPIPKNAGWESADVIIYRRQPVPGRFPNSTVICKSLKSNGGSLIYEHSISLLLVSDSNIRQRFSKYTHEN